MRSMSFRGRNALIVDVETTGLDPRQHEIVELGLVLIRVDQAGTHLSVTDEYASLRQPSRPIPNAASRIHGITDDMVLNQQLDHDQVHRLLSRATVYIAHNARFDRAFLARLYPEVLTRSWLCSMRQIDWFRLGYRSRSLADLLRALGVDDGNEPRHRALADCRRLTSLLASQAPDGSTFLHHLLMTQLA
jgi:DNA polymerase-3 subunit epsilon